MCGIAGCINLNPALPPKMPINAEAVLSMLSMIQHRGPDGFGVYHDAAAGLGSARLSIIDLNTGDQPICNEDESLWIVFNGEIFNYVELRPKLEALGHRFVTHSDTEVILHAYEEYGPACLQHLNGQWAFAIWDALRRELFIARDRLGVRPVFYAQQHGQFVFGSEVKALLAHPAVTAQIDPAGLSEVFTYWSAQAPQTHFVGVSELPAGHYLHVVDGQVNIQQYWSPEFDPTDAPSRKTRTTEALTDELEALLTDATRIRLRADVPVGAYLSGGLDSSLISALARQQVPEQLRTFSIAFADDAAFDESAYQKEMAAFLGTRHDAVACTHADIAQAFSQVVWHAEASLLRTAPAPMFLLSKLVHAHNIKVVLTGEGADELLAGYDIFKEMAIRRFWAKQPESKLRPQLLRRLYPEIAGLSAINPAFLQAFFKRELGNTASPFYSHAVRWGNAARLRKFLVRDDAPAMPRLPAEFSGWSNLAQAQHLELMTFLSSYLLSSQGDRMALSHSVEGRYPFLDYRVVDFCNRLPASVKLSGMTEKWLLRCVAAKHLPTRIQQRRKRPYRAPILRVFFGPNAPDYVQELLSATSLQRTGLFKAGPVQALAANARAAQQNGHALSEADEMALVGVISGQLLHHQFVQRFQTKSLDPTIRLKMCSPKSSLATTSDTHDNTTHPRLRH
jgi:asparagine synthase (glutamine-hydrolysing)